MIDANAPRSTSTSPSISPSESPSLGEQVYSTLDRLEDGFYRACDTSYHAVVDNAPQWVQNNPEPVALGLGLGAAYITTWIGQRVFGLMSPNAVRILSKIAIYATPALVLSGFAIDPDGMQQLADNHPVYIAGLFGLGLGAEARFIQEGLKKPEKTDSIDDKVSPDDLAVRERMLLEDLDDRSV